MSEKKKNWLLSAIWLIPIVPLVIAWTMALTGYGVPEDTRNNGELLSAGLIVPESIIEAQNGEWGLLIVSDSCDNTCEQQLYRMQQLYLSMGKEAERLQTVWVSNAEKRQQSDLSVDVALADNTVEQTNTAKPQFELPGEMTFKKMIQMNDSAIFNWFSQQDIHWQDQSIFLIDPLGNMVLRFNPELNGRDMMSDIKWLFKASRVG